MASAKVSPLSVKEPKIVCDLRQLTTAVFTMSRGLPKHLRPTIASRIERHCLDAWLGTREFVLLAGPAKPECAHQIRSAIAAVDVVGCLLELCLELRAVSEGAFGELIGHLEQIRRQLYGLQRKYGNAARTSGDPAQRG